MVLNQRMFVTWNSYQISDGKTTGPPLVKLLCAWRALQGGSRREEAEISAFGHAPKTWKRVSKRRLDFRDAVLEGEANQLGVGVQVKPIHHLVFVKFHRAGRDRQRVTDLFGRSAFRQQLENLPLPRRER